MRKPAGVGIAWLVATIVAVTIAAAAVGSVRSVVTNVPTALGIAAIRAMEAEPDSLEIDGDETSAIEAAPTSTLAQTVESGITTESSTTTTVAVTTTTQQVETSTTRTEAEEPARSSRQAEATSRPPAQPKTSTPTVGDTATATTAPPATTTTTTAPPATTTTTTAVLTTTPPSPNAYTKEIVTDGGSFSVRVEGDAVMFGRATLSTATATVWRFDLLNGGPQVVDVQFTSLDNQHPAIRVVVTVTNGVLDILRDPS
ncbi:MAG: hypothetical protein M3092_02275 [Actinomycetia bacterium]|nr:hypothetical protein [Actinomycetes bacterium]